MSTDGAPDGALDEQLDDAWVVTHCLAGLLPLVYSTHEATERQVGWLRRGHDVCYYQNHIRRRSGYYYTLSFKLRVAHASDTLYVAYSHPYTLTDLNRYLKRLEEDPSTAKRFRRRPLCATRRALSASERLLASLLACLLASLGASERL